MSKTVISRKLSPQNEDDAPKLDAGFFANALSIQPRQLLSALGSGPKQQITLRVDQDVIEFFKSQGKGYQRLMNFALRTYMFKQQQAAGKKLRSTPRKRVSASR
jgi:uncharacterized protein (DUF4415 family)